MFTNPFAHDPLDASPKNVTPLNCLHLMVVSTAAVVDTVVVADVVCVDVAVVPRRVLVRLAADTTKGWPDTCSVMLPFFSSSKMACRADLEVASVALLLRTICVSNPVTTLRSLCNVSSCSSAHFLALLPLPLSASVTPSTSPDNNAVSRRNSSMTASMSAFCTAKLVPDSFCGPTASTIVYT